MPEQIERALHLAPDLTTTSSRVLGVNLVRKYALLVNDSDSVAYLSLGASAEANKGIRLNAQGGSFEINATNLWTGEIYAISVGVTKRLTITEF